MRHVVSVADIRQATLLQISESFQQCEIVRQRLAGMLKITECVDHGDARMLRHSSDRLLGKRTQHDQVDPALQVVCHVAQRFASVNSLMCLIDEHRRPAQAHHSCFKRQPRAQRRLLEEHHDLPARERPLKICRTRFHNSGEMQHCIDPGWAQVAS